MVSRDLDDIVTLLVGRVDVLAAIFESPQEIRGFIIDAFRTWRNQPLVWDAMEGYVTSADSRRRLDHVRSVLSSP
jgi:hypothetical protein